MPLDGGGAYTLPSGTTAVPDNVILSSQWNGFTTDLVNVLNTPTSIARGGTASNNATAARSALGLAIGTDVQRFSTSLNMVADLTPASDRIAYYSGASTAALTPFTSFARSFSGAVDAAAARTTLGVAIGSDVQGYDAGTLTETNTPALQASDVNVTSPLTAQKTISPAVASEIRGLHLIEDRLVTTPSSEEVFNNLDEYIMIELAVVRFETSSNARHLVQFSADNGATFESSGYDSASADDDSGAASNSGFYFSQNTVPFLPAGSYRFTNFNKDGRSTGTGLGFRNNYSIDKCAGRSPAGIFNALKILPSSGSFTEFHVQIYGIKG